VAKTRLRFPRLHVAKPIMTRKCRDVGIGKCRLNVG
jgi:hypothetical protein